MRRSTLGGGARAAGCWLTAVALTVAPDPLSAQGLTIRLAPEAQAMRWADEQGLEDATFLGGGLSLGFGRYVTLRGSYRTAGVVRTAFQDASFVASDGSTLAENRVDASLFSGSVLFRLGARRVAPVLSGSGGVLSLQPEGRDDARQIFAAYGGGLDVRLTPWLDGQILLEDVRLRLDRSLLTRSGAPPSEDPEHGIARSGLGLTASFGMRAGDARSSGRADDVDQGFGALLKGSAEGLLVPLESQVSVVRFDDAYGLPDQATVGVRTGLDFGPYFGIRGQYWHGVSDAFDDFQGVTGWSGEVQFNVGKVTGISPHMLVGFGQTRFDEDFLAEKGVELEDQNALVLGAGLGIPLSDRSRLLVTVRDHITSSGSLDQAASTADLRHNLSVSAGFSVLLVGRRSPGTAPGTRPVMTSDSSDYRSRQIVEIPLPKEGELYVRYGPGGRTLPAAGPDSGAVSAVDSAAVGAAVAEELTRLLAGGEVTLPDSARAALQARVLARLSALAPSGADSAAATRTGVPLPGVAPGAAADPEVEALRRQVEELTLLVREGMLLQAAGGALAGRTTVNVGPAGTAGAAAPADGAHEPFLRALEGRLGRSSLDEGYGGLAVSAEAFLKPLSGDDRLFPFAALALTHTGIGATDRSAVAHGSVTTFGTDLGVTAVLPHAGPVWPTASLLVAVASAGTSGDLPADEDAMDRRYGGLSLGMGFVLGFGYRQSPESRTLLTGSLRKIWAGHTSRWSLEGGMRLVFPPRAGAPVGPFSVHAAEAPSPGVVAPAHELADTLPAVPAATGAPQAPADTVVARLLERLDTLERQVREVSAAREQALAEARSARARADSLAAAAEGVELERARAERQAEDLRSSALTELTALSTRSPFVVSVEDAGGEIRIVLGGDLFAVGATDLSTAAAADVRSLGAILARFPDALVTADGHTDSTGTEDANLIISRLRAEAVRRELVAGGVDAARITATGSGESSPVADNATREGRARNRRVEVTVRSP